MTINLLAGTATGGDAAGDTLASIENVTGSANADSLTGDTGTNVLYGGAAVDTLRGGDGDDFLAGGAGNDVLDGGAGVDLLDFGAYGAAVTVNLLTNVIPGTEGTDTFISIEGVRGSPLPTP